jgi:hypothetical protein
VYFIIYRPATCYPSRGAKQRSKSRARRKLSLTFSVEGLEFNEHIVTSSEDEDGGPVVASSASADERGSEKKDSTAGKIL